MGMWLSLCLKKIYSLKFLAILKYLKEQSRKKQQEVHLKQLEKKW